MICPECGKEMEATINEVTSVLPKTRHVTIKIVVLHHCSNCRRGEYIDKFRTIALKGSVIEIETD